MLSPLTIGFLSAYAFTRFSFRGATFLPLFYLVVRMVPRITLFDKLAVADIVYAPPLRARRGPEASPTIRFVHNILRGPIPAAHHKRNYNAGVNICLGMDVPV